MTELYEPWRDLSLTDEQDGLVKAHIAVQMHLVRKVKHYLLTLAVAAFIAWLGGVARSLLPVPAWQYFDVLFDLAFKWVLGVAALLIVVLIAGAMRVLHIAQKKAAELPLSPHQAKQVRNIADCAVELALFGRAGFAILNKVRRK